MSNEAESRSYSLGKFLGRIQGFKDAADVLRSAANKEAVIKIFVPGQAPKHARGINRALLNNCAGILDHMACDMEGGRIVVDPGTDRLVFAPAAPAAEEAK